MPPKDPLGVGVPYSASESGTPTTDALAHSDTGVTCSRSVGTGAAAVIVTESLTQAPAQLSMPSVPDANTALLRARWIEITSERREQSKDNDRLQRGGLKFTKSDETMGQDVEDPPAMPACEPSEVLLARDTGVTRSRSSSIALYESKLQEVLYSGDPSDNLLNDFRESSMGLPEKYTSDDSKVCAPSFRQQVVIDEGGPMDPARVLKLQSNIESYILGNVELRGSSTSMRPKQTR